MRQATRSSSSQGEYQQNGDREGNGRDYLLEQAADRLDHAQAIGRLNASPFQPVIEDRVFIGLQIKREA